MEKKKTGGANKAIADQTSHAACACRMLFSCSKDTVCPMIIGIYAMYFITSRSLTFRLFILQFSDCSVIMLSPSSSRHTSHTSSLSSLPSNLLFSNNYSFDFLNNGLQTNLIFYGSPHFHSIFFHCFGICRFHNCLIDNLLIQKKRRYPFCYA